MASNHYEETLNDYTPESNTHSHIRQRYKSPATRARSWQRAIAWRRQMGFLPVDADGHDNMPSLVASDVVQQQYLGATEYIDDLCQSGAMDIDAARPLRRCLLDWLTQQINMMCRIEELELEVITCQNQVNRNLNIDLDVNRITNVDENINLDTNLNHNANCTRIDKDTQTIHPVYISHKPKVVYNTDKCSDKITPIKFVSGDNNNAHTEQTNTIHKQNTNTILESHNAQLPADKVRVNTNNEDLTKSDECNHKRGNTYELDYKTLEENIRLSRLENVKTFQTALRLVTRLMIKGGRNICYPVSEQTDRLMLKAENIPTDGKALCDLLRKACSRRGESLNLDETYKDLVRAHGRVFYDGNLPSPDCYIHTHCVGYEGIAN